MGSYALKPSKWVIKNDFLNLLLDGSLLLYSSSLSFIHEF